MSRVVLAAVLVVVAAGCGGGGDERPTVVAGFYPLAWAAEQVGGDASNVVNLTPAGAEPHDLELSPSDVEQVREAELVVYVSGFQPALDDAVAERDGRSLDARLEATDPHVWLDGMSFWKTANALGRALGREEASGRLLRRLVELDNDFRRGLSRCARREIVTTHDAFRLFSASYGLEQLSLAGSSPEAEPSPRELERLIERVRQVGAKTVFAEPLVSDRVAQTVAREVGAEVAVLDPLEGLSEERLDAGEDYLSVMRDNLAALRKALGCR